MKDKNLVGRNKRTRAVPACAARSLPFAAVLLLVLGCASPEARVQRIQGEKDELLATIRQQRDANRSLNTQIASLEQRLDQAETQLAGGTPRKLTQQPTPNRST